jgi:hypothetical protein
MRNILIAIIVTLLPASMAAAEPFRAPKDKAAPPDRLAPAAKRTVNGCAAYGAGFVKVDGSDTCMKIGGAVSIGASSGGSIGSH